ncbi:MAG: metallophosphoesterase family protein [Gemmatimonadetes bacterium]|nr:metallophosphoesterase family protein [Gemmatimonadota bacterium]
MIIGLISDTHGLVRPDVHTALAGVDLILHAGDVGGTDVLDELALIAPVRAVFGNTDPVDEPGLELAIDITLGGLRVHVSHGHEVGRVTARALASAYDADLIVYGHTHRQRVDRVGGRIVVNPGAAGARRYDLEASVGRVTIEGGVVDVSLVGLAP